MTGDLPSAAGELLVNVTLFLKLWAGLHLKRRTTTVLTNSLLFYGIVNTHAHTALYFTACGQVSFYILCYFFKVKSHK